MDREFLERLASNLKVQSEDADRDGRHDSAVTLRYLALAIEDTLLCLEDEA